MNGINLERFPFEYDLTWMAFFQNAEGRTYARYGGREDRDAESHLSRDSLLRVMTQVLALHENNDVQPVNRYEPLVDATRTPEDIPTMEAMIARREESCIHCHDVKVAELTHLRNQGLLEKDMVFTYPPPNQFGLVLDRDMQQRVERVIEGSAADDAGLRRDDVLETMDGQRVLTLADATRVLEFWQAGQSLPISFRRDGVELTTQVQLPEGWREAAEAGWRASTHVVGPGGGFWGSPASSQQRRNLGLGPGDMAFHVNYIYADHAKAAGFRNGDIITEIDGQNRDMNARQIHAYLQLNRQWGDEIDIKIRRGRETLDLKMRLPLEPPD